MTSAQDTPTIGMALVQLLRRHNVELVFGIPGVHTVELYRGLEDSGIRHITPRHEQGAGFMADGYARVSGRPGVALVISGPGLTNTLTPMAQARADSVPMLVVSGVSRTSSLGKGLGYLHELPDQQSMAASVALRSMQIGNETALGPLMADVFAQLEHDRPGPVHIEVPTDVMPRPAMGLDDTTAVPTVPDTRVEHSRLAYDTNLRVCTDTLRSRQMPVILAGGGARHAEDSLQQLAETLGAPVIQTTNARGLMHAHPLTIPASASLDSVRELIDKADVVIALGTELAPTDYDMYERGWEVPLERMIRVDVSTDQHQRLPARHTVTGRVESVLPDWMALLNGVSPNPQGEQDAKATREAALAELEPAMRLQLDLLNTIQRHAPGAVLVGDSTQVIYAGNLYYDHDRAGGWFNAATGYGALGYAIPASVGASLAAPDATVFCLLGDGGAQFTLTELMTAVDEALPIIFLIWNNRGYQEIATSMRSAGITAIGCTPTPPDFRHIASACGIPHHACDMTPASLSAVLSRVLTRGRGPEGPTMIELDMPRDYV